MMDRERPSASELEGKIPEAWIGQEVMIETTETLSSDLRASAPSLLGAPTKTALRAHREQGRPHLRTLQALTAPTE